MIFFLCSDHASYITGQTIGADGGFEATGIGLPALRKAVRIVRRSVAHNARLLAHYRAGRIIGRRG